MRALLVLPFLTGCIGLTQTATVGKEDSAAGPDGGPTGPFTVDPGSIDFGTLALGGEADQELLITNTSDGLLRLDAVIDGDPAFSLTESSMAVAPTEETVLSVHFEAETSVRYAADLSLSDLDGNTVLVPLSGAGEGAGTDTPTDTPTDDPTDTPSSEGALVVSPSSYDFGQVDRGDTDTTSFTLRNDGDADLLVSDLRFSDAAFTLASTTLTLPQVLRPGSSGTATVAFTPSALRTYAATLTVTSDDPDGPTTVSLAGEGADLCDVCSGIISVDTGGDPYTIDSFISILGAPSSVTVEISNIGDMDLNVSDVYVNNDTVSTCGDFTIAGWRGAVAIAPGGTTLFQVTYRATSVCVELPLASFDENVVHILSDDPSQSDYVIELSAIGIN